MRASRIQQTGRKAIRGLGGRGRAREGAWEKGDEEMKMLARERGRGAL